MKKDFFEHIAKLVDDIVSRHQFKHLEHALKSAIILRLEKFGYDAIDLQDFDTFAKKKLNIIVNNEENICIALKHGRLEVPILSFDRNVDFILDDRDGRLSIVIG